MDDRPISNAFDTPKTAINTPLPASNDEASILEPPRASYLLTDSARTSSYATATPQTTNNSGPLPPADFETQEPPRASYLLTDSARAASYADATPQSINNPGPFLPADFETRGSPADNDEGSIGLEPPRASYLLTDSARTSSYATGTPLSDNNSGPLLPAVDKSESDEDADQESKSKPTKTGRKRLILALIALAVLVIIALAVVLPVYLTVIKPNQNNTNASAQPPGGGDSSGGGDGDGGGNTGNTQATTGGDGSTVTTSDGSTFIYNNKLGGFWVDDPDDPFNNNAQPNSWTPPLNQSWKWGKDRVYGVNLGGLFVLEPFIAPALFQRYPGAVDEWSLSLRMAADTANGGLNQIEEHYKTFITEEDIAEIAGAGLNWIRLPIPFWAIETWPGEPFLAKTSWKYILQVFAWCRKYGLRVNLDLHNVPGSANAYNHGGRAGALNFLNGVMGIANAQRTMDYIRFITEFISQPQYKDVVLMFGIINEALVLRSTLTSFYLEAHNMIRGITGIGEGNGAYISIHDGFAGLPSWAGFLPNSDRIALDTHPYFAFSGSLATDPIDTGTGPGAGGIWPADACGWARGISASRVAFGVTMAGEFSNGFNDCGLFLKGVAGSSTYGGNCDDWEDSSNWTPGTKAGVKSLALAQMDALQDWFFWTWKVGNSTAGRVESPLWSYQLGLRNGWMPTDPREAVGKCASLGVSGAAFDGTYPQPWMTGGAGAGAIAPSVTAEFPWPPTVMDADAPVSLLPTYTPTGTIPTLPPPSLTATPTKSVDVGNGWFDQQDTTGAMTPVAGCEYPDAWDALSAAVPPVCGGGPTIAPAPARR